jgi:hypothetical protein
MQRFAQNRWWAFILTLCLLLSSGAAISPAFSAGDGSDLIEIGGEGGGGSDPSGDPDSPAGPGKRGAGSGRATPGGYRYAATSVGDGGSAKSVWVWRFHVVLRSLMVRYSR